jgi:hypothetical protein
MNLHYQKREYNLKNDKKNSLKKKEFCYVKVLNESVTNSSESFLNESSFEKNKPLKNKKKVVAEENQISQKPILKNFQNGVKYKTEICKNFEIYNFCKFGSRCCFAHGKSELRKKKDFNDFYKTKICKHFNENGFCPYGNRCQYFHFNSHNIYSELLDTFVKKFELDFQDDPSKNIFNFFKINKSFHSRLTVFRSLYDFDG